MKYVTMFIVFSVSVVLCGGCASEAPVTTYTVNGQDMTKEEAQRWLKEHPRRLPVQEARLPAPPAAVEVQVLSAAQVSPPPFLLARDEGVAQQPAPQPLPKPAVQVTQKPEPPVVVEVTKPSFRWTDGTIRDYPQYMPEYMIEASRQSEADRLSNYRAAKAQSVGAIEVARVSQAAAVDASRANMKLQLDLARQPYYGTPSPYGYYPELQSVWYNNAGFYGGNYDPYGYGFYNQTVPGYYSYGSLGFGFGASIYSGYPNFTVFNDEWFGFDHNHHHNNGWNGNNQSGNNWGGGNNRGNQSANQVSAQREQRRANLENSRH